MRRSCAFFILACLLTPLSSYAQPTPPTDNSAASKRLGPVVAEVKPAVTVPVASTTKSKPVSEISSRTGKAENTPSPWFELGIQALGALATTVAAGFAFMSARGAMIAAEEMRESRRAATKPRLSYKILDRALYVKTGSEEKREFSVSISDRRFEGSGREFNYSSPSIQLSNFSSPALNVNIVFDFEPRGESNLTFLRKFLDLGDDDVLEISSFGLHAGRYAVAARMRGELFIPHIGPSDPVSISLPFAIMPRYALSVVNTIGLGIERSRNGARVEFDDFPAIRIRLSFINVDGVAFEQIFLLRYELQSFAHPPGGSLHLLAQELPSEPMREVSS